MGFTSLLFSYLWKKLNHNLHAFNILMLFFFNLELHSSFTFFFGFYSPLPLQSLSLCLESEKGTFNLKTQNLWRCVCEEQQTRMADPYYNWIYRQEYDINQSPLASLKGCPLNLESNLKKYYEIWNTSMCHCVCRDKYVKIYGDNKVSEFVIDFMDVSPLDFKSSQVC